MKNKVIQFPQPRPGQAGTLRDGLVIFSLGEQRFALTVAEVKRKPAAVIPIRKRSKANSTPR